MFRYLHGARTAPLLGALALAALTMPAHAQVRPGSVEVGVLGGFVEGDELYDNAGIFGARAAYNLSRVIGFEMRYTGSPTTRTTAVFGAAGNVEDSVREDVFIHQLGFNALLNLNSAVINPYLAAGAGIVVLDGTHFGVNLGLGTRIHINDFFFAKVDVRGWFSSEAPAQDEYAHFHATVGFGVQLGGDYDMDGDGITNTADKCPTTAEDKDDFEDSDGCPEDDNDKDGIKDADDKCPMKAEDKDEDRDDDGCPDVDDDNDGIDNDADKCKDVPEDMDGFEDDDGCPEKDNDKDGIEDAADLCPLEAETKNNWADEDGCPEKDTDKDGVWNIVDKCVDAAETLNGYDDLDGCPDAVPADLTAVLGIQTDIKFERKSEAIFRRSLKPLDTLAAVLKRHPKATIEIQTTGFGVPDAMALSNKRSAGVWSYLTTTGGVTEASLRGKGIGDAALPADAPKGAKKDRLEVHLWVPSTQPQPKAPTLDELKALKARGGKAMTKIEERAAKAKKAAEERAKKAAPAVPATPTVPAAPAVPAAPKTPAVPDAAPLKPDAPKAPTAPNPPN